jgi:hypothetical protein
MDPEFWDQLTKKTSSHPGAEMVVDNDNEFDLPFEDDSDLPCDTIIASMMGLEPASVAVTIDGDFVSTAAAESLDNEELGRDNRETQPEMTLGRGKRKRIENRHYGDHLFWRHDGDASDDELVT